MQALVGSPALEATSSALSPLLTRVISKTRRPKHSILPSFRHFVHHIHLGHIFIHFVTGIPASYISPSPPTLDLPTFSDQDEPYPGNLTCSPLNGPAALVKACNKRPGCQLRTISGRDIHISFTLPPSSFLNLSGTSNLTAVLFHCTPSHFLHLFTNTVQAQTFHTYPIQPSIPS